MNREKSMFEVMGGTYTEVDGILYPNICIGTELEEQESKTRNIGKYGHLWISYMKENHGSDYWHYVRTGTLKEKAENVNEEAYERLEILMEQYLRKNKPRDSNSTMEMWRLREQAKAVAEEVIYGEFVYQYH